MADPTKMTKAQSVRFSTVRMILRPGANTSATNTLDEARALADFILGTDDGAETMTGEDDTEIIRAARLLDGKEKLDA